MHLEKRPTPLPTGMDISMNSRVSLENALWTDSAYQTCPPTDALEFRSMFQAQPQKKRQQGRTLRQESAFKLLATDTQQAPIDRRRKSKTPAKPSSSGMPSQPFPRPSQNTGRHGRSGFSRKNFRRSQCFRRKGPLLQPRSALPSKPPAKGSQHEKTPLPER